MRVLPEAKKEILKMPRAYLANAIHTILGDDFKVWSDQRIAARNIKVTKDRDMTI